MVVESFAYCAPGFVGVGAVGKTAITANREYFAEVMRHFLALEIEGAEAANARCVDNAAGYGL